MKTVIVNDKEVERNWILVDAENQVLGRVASKVANILRGKNKVTYSPSVDVGDYVVIVNADKIKLTGQKPFTKSYFRHNTRPGGWVDESFAHVMARDARLPLERAIKGMLPKTVLGRRMYSKLFVYADAQHPHAAQKPQAISL